MAVPKSPFFIVQDFLSPLLCEQIVGELDFFTPDVNTDGDPVRMIKHNETCQELLFERFNKHILSIDQHYNIKYKGMEPINFEWYTGGVASKPQCENSHYLRKKWVKLLDREFTGIVFFSDFQDVVPFDSDYEVYGGKLEFPQHRFGFNPERGTLILFPSGPHFINSASFIQAGDLWQARFHFTCENPYFYNPEDFPGDFTNWFNNLK